MRSGGESNGSRMHGRPMIIPLVDDEGAVHVHPHSVVGTRGEAIGPFGKINRSRPTGDEVVNVNQRINSGEVRSHSWHGRRRPCARIPVFGIVAVAWRWRWCAA